MEPGSFGALASVTSIGLLADRVMLALEGVERRSAGALSAEDKVVFHQAARFIGLALEASRCPSSQGVSPRAVRAEQAYHRAVQAAKASSETVSQTQDADQQMIGFLSEVRDALGCLEEGGECGDRSRSALKVFFAALSNMATNEHARMSLRSVVQWGVSA